LGGISRGAIGREKLPPVFVSEGGAEEAQKSVDEVMNVLEKKIPGTETSTPVSESTLVPESTPVPKSPPSSTLPSSTSLPPFASPTFSYITKDDAAKLAEKIRRNIDTTISPLRTQPSISEIPRIRWGKGRGPLTAEEARKAASDIKKELGKEFTPPTFSYLTKDGAANLIEQIRRNIGALSLQIQPPVSETPRIRWGEGRGPLTAKEARKAASDIKKQLKGKHAVIIGGMPLLLDEDDIIHYYNTQIANQK
jgi:hypothetical protein